MNIVNIMEINAVAIKKRRKELKLTQEELANKIGVSRNTIKNYENGAVIPDSKRELLSKFLFGFESFFVKVQNIGNEMFEGINPLIDRIKQLISYLNLTQSEFADRMGMKQQNLSRILNGKVNIGDGVINKIILSYDVNRDWLLTGKGEMLKENVAQPSLAKEFCIPNTDNITISREAFELMSRQAETINSQQHTIESLYETIKNLVTK